MTSNDSTYDSGNERLYPLASFMVIRPGPAPGRAIPRCSSRPAHVLTTSRTGVPGSGQPSMVPRESARPINGTPEQRQERG